MSKLITSNELYERLKTIVNIPEDADVIDMNIRLNKGDYAIIEMTRYATDNDDVYNTTFTPGGSIIDEKLMLISVEEHARLQTLEADLIVAQKKLAKLNPEEHD